VPRAALPPTQRVSAGTILCKQILSFAHKQHAMRRIFSVSFYCHKVYKTQSCSQSAEASAVNIQLCASVPTESQSSQISRIAIVLMCITFPIVGLRVYSRLRFSKQLFEDDWFALISAVRSYPDTRFIPG
jgi:hypothetical protein